MQARMRSLAIITRLTGQRSTKTPAAGAIRDTGAMYATITSATSVALPCRRKVMRLMTPKMARKSPKTETNCASHSVRKAGCAKTVRKLAGCGDWGTRFNSTC